MNALLLISLYLPSFSHGRQGSRNRTKAEMLLEGSRTGVDLKIGPEIKSRLYKSWIEFQNCNICKLLSVVIAIQEAGIF